MNSAPLGPLSRATFAAAFLSTLLLTGCGTGLQGVSRIAPAPVVPAAKLAGAVMGGQQPVKGVSLQFYLAGNTGYGSAPTPLGSPATTSDTGNFYLPSFTCPAVTATNPQLVYVVGTGGYPFSNISTPNPNLAMMAARGTCANVGSSFISINELTTVASVWALAPFMTDNASGVPYVGGPASNVTGLTNAFNAVGKLVNVATGQLQQAGTVLPAGATIPRAEIDTLADILQNCVNSAGGSASGGVSDNSICGNLFAAVPAGNHQAADTVTAALHVAQFPGTNVAGINNQRAAQPAFMPAFDVNSPPAAWTIAITYNAGGNLTNVTGMAADQGGNIWLTSGSNSTVVELNNTGAVAGTQTNSIATPSAIAIDQNGAAWVANSGNSTVSQLATISATPSTYMNNGLSSPNGVAVDGSGNVWVSNGNGGISAFTSTGGVLGSSPFTGAGVSSPVGIAINPK